MSKRRAYLGNPRSKVGYARPIDHEHISNPTFGFTVGLISITTGIILFPVVSLIREK
jgi:hypothetical protein